MTSLKALSLAGLLTLAAHSAASAFCGFYVARADAELFNRASKVILARDGDRTVITMVSDYEGDPTEFAMVVPVPTFLERDQIHIGDMAAIDHLDAFTAPRLVEYFDEDPCNMRVYEKMLGLAASADARHREDEAANRALGVTIEASYTVGEYDILILSAEQSDGLETWLRQNGYRVPDGAGRVLRNYIRQDMRFFVAKVNLEKRAALGYQMLRPLQIAFESDKFMLPIRLGMVNANGPQELFVFALTRTGRVETTNYRTVRLPTDTEIPLFVKEEFGDFYRAMFDHQIDEHGMSVVFLEHAWDMSWCDPCASQPLSPDELRRLGVFWLDETPGGRRQAAPNAFVTRLHVRYDDAHFPDDLFFQETGDRTNFQGRYVLRHAWTGDADCDAAKAYRNDLRERRLREVENLVALTGWERDAILAKCDIPAAGDPEPTWYQRLFGGR